jgi:hypothetical protein
VVAPTAPTDYIGTRPALHGVVTIRSRVDHVRALSGVDEVAAQAAINRIVTGVSEELVATIQTSSPVGLVSPKREVRSGPEKDKVVT